MPKRKKKNMLLASFALFIAASVAAVATAEGEVMPMACHYQYTYCSDFRCPTGSGAAGQHVYHCDTHPYVRVIDTCCG